MKEVTTEERKSIQLTMMDAIHEFCLENKIKYSLSDGTLLGAVRHKGFIPWDDDIDIYMLREDYERFEKEFPTILHGHYVLSSINRDSEWHLPFAKVWDNRTVSYLVSRNIKQYGIFIDIFPIDDVPDNLTEWNKYMKSMKLRNYILSNKFRPLKKTNSIFKNIGILIIRIFTFWVTRQQAINMMAKYAQKHNNKNYKYCYENTYGPSLNQPFPKSLFNELIYYKFEDREYLAFKDSETYLTLSYGDFMRIPPEEDRICHEEKAYWVKSV